MASQCGICPVCDQKQPIDEHGRMRIHRIAGQWPGRPDCVGSGALMRNLAVDLTGLPPDQALNLGALTSDLIEKAHHEGFGKGVESASGNIDKRLALAEQRGRQWAINALRAPGGRGTAARVLLDEGGDVNGRMIAFALAGYLEALATQPTDTTTEGSR